MDVISWVAGLVAGAVLPLPKALLVATGTSLLIRVYQYFVTETWSVPDDLLGGAAMIAASCLFAYIGSIFRARRTQRTTEGGNA